MDESKRFDYYIAKRQRYFSQVQQIADRFKTLTLENVQSNQAFFNKLLDLENKFEELQEEIEQFNVNVVEARHKIEITQVQTSLDHLLYSARGRYLELLQTIKVPIAEQPTVSSTRSIPKISIPPFYGKIDQWPEFISLFRSIIHNNDSLSPTEKFQHLRTLLKNDALAVISNIHFAPENYPAAFQALTDRYQNERRLANFYVNQIREFPKLNSASYDNFQRFLSVHLNSVNSLKALGIKDLADYLLFQLSLYNLDSDTRKRFEDQHDSRTTPSYKDLMTYIADQCRTYELFSHDGKPSTSRTQTSKTHISSPKNALFTSTPSSKVSYQASPTSTSFKIFCAICKGDHPIIMCPDFLSKSIEARYDKIKSLKRCFNCLGTHMVSSCQSDKTCRYCHSRTHNSTLHRHTGTHVPSTSSSEAPNTVTPVSKVSPAVSQTLTCNISCNIPDDSLVILGTAQILIRDASGVLRRCRAIVDPGSQISAITESCVQALSLNRFKCPISISGISNASIKTRGMVNCDLISIHDTSLQIGACPVILSSIANNQPSISLSDQIFSRFRNIQLADPEFNRSGPIDFLIGADLYTDILEDSGRVIIKGKPAGINTMFGWIIMGQIPCENSKPVKTSLLVQNLNVDSLLKRFWEIEEVQCPQIKAPEDSICENFFISTHSRIKDGRYMVKLPFINNPKILAKNTNRVSSSFLSLERRLLRSPESYSAYQAFMHEYLSLGHMSLASSPSSYVIPHHCVFKETSSTTKLRVVFNGSDSNTIGTSLNQQLMPGPKLQNDLSDILNPFRMYPVALCGDIKMMYRQILIHPEDRQFQHIFWRKTSVEPVKEFELNTVTYGLTPSAYLSQRVLQQLVNDEGQSYPLASHAILNQTYVDDIVSGASSIEEAHTLQSELISLLGLGKFELRKWSSNEVQVLEHLPTDHLETPLNFSCHDNVFKILGLLWDPKRDVFTYNVVPFDYSLSKRNILSYVARTFDPLGWLSPLVFHMKHFLQILWLNGVNWDDPLPPDLVESWVRFVNDMPLIERISIPRHISNFSYSHRLIGFCDASEKGFAAAIYLRSVSLDNQITCNLLKARTKVAPLKTLSIPRLELSGALLLARLFHSMSKFSSTLNLEEVLFFSDSKIVLQWLRISPHKLKTFVANRVVEILEKTSPTSWNHIQSELNPADIASRGSLASSLVDHALWWHGPTFLLTPVSCWPTSVEDEFFGTTNLELKANTHSLLAQLPSNDLFDHIATFSKLNRLQRVYAYIQRYKFNLRNPTQREVGPLTSDELHSSLMLCVSITQRQTLPMIFEAIAESKPIPAPFHKLSPFIDDVGLLRVGGRLRHSDLPPDSKFPLLLSKSCHLAALLCDYYHVLSLHSGPRTVQALIQQRYWIISLRCLVRSRIRRCLTCHKFRASPVQPIMSDLPSHRTRVSRPFTHTGVDFGGPFLIKQSKRRNAPTVPCYLSLFVCSATKAVHLELVSELSTVAFLAAFDRFISRRGLCKHVYSDCGSNFKGAARHLKEVYNFLSLHDHDITNHLSQREITWHFNPPHAPNFGGLWEAGIKSAKLLLHRVLKNYNLTFEELTTLFARIEAILNSRPLCAISNDPHDGPDYLSPGHFLIGSPLLAPPETIHDPETTLLNRWQRVTQLHQVFWSRWSSEYLNTLMQRQKWTRNSPELQIGDVVFFYGTSTSPLNWPIGRIENLHPGQDGISRVATIRTSNGRLTRPLNKLVILPSE